MGQYSTMKPFTELYPEIKKIELMKYSQQTMKPVFSTFVLLIFRYVSLMLNSVPYNCENQYW